MEKIKKRRAILFILAWILIILILNICFDFSFSVTSLKQYLLYNTAYAVIIFIALWFLRFIVLLPGVTLMILGGICFGPLYGFLLSMIGILLSESFIYIVSKYFKTNLFKTNKFSKYKSFNAFSKKDPAKFLFLGIICPVSPTDMICFISASYMSYSKYILIIFLGNIPFMALYSFLGTSYENSLLSIILIIFSILLISIYTFKYWNNIKVTALEESTPHLLK